MANLYELEFRSNAKAWSEKTIKQIGKVGEAYDNLGNNVGGSSSGGDIKGIEGFTGKAAKFGAGALVGGIDQLAKAFRTLAPLFGSVASSFITANAELQRLAIRMETAAGGVEEGMKEFKRVIDRTITTPFSIESIADSTAKLLAADLDPDMVDKWMGSLTDAIAAYGLGGENLRYATIALFQMVAKGDRIFMEELRRQLAEQVPTAFPALAAAMEMTMEELFIAIEKGEVEATKNISGMFVEMDKLHGGAAAKLMQTWDGQIKRVQNVWKLFMYDIGEAHGSFESITGVVRAIGDAIQNFRLNPEMKATIDSMGESLQKFFVNFSDPRMFEILLENISETVATILEMFSGLGEVIASLVLQVDRLSGKVSFKPLQKFGIDDDFEATEYFEARQILKDMTKLGDELKRIPLGQMFGSFEQLSAKFGEETAEKIKEMFRLKYELQEIVGQSPGVLAPGTMQYDMLQERAKANSAEMEKDRVASNQRALEQMTRQETAHWIRMSKTMEEKLGPEQIMNKWKEQDFAFANAQLRLLPEDSSELEKVQTMVNAWTKTLELQGRSDYKYPHAELQKWLDKLSEIQKVQDNIEAPTRQTDLAPAEVSAAISDETIDRLADKVSGRMLEAPIVPLIDDVVWDEALAGLETKVSEFGPIESAIDITTSLSLNTDAINEDIATIQKELNCIDIKVRPTEICDEALSNTLVGNVGNDTLQGGAANDDFFALDEFMFEDALFELKGLIEDFDNIEPTDMNLEQAEREIQSLADALKQLQFDDQITSTDLARAQEMVDLWVDIIAAQGEEVGYHFPYEELDKAKEHLKSLVADFAVETTVKINAGLDEATWDDAFAALDEKIAYFDSADTDIEFEVSETDIRGLSDALMQLENTEIVSELDLTRAASLVDYWNLIATSQENIGYAFPTEELAKAEAHYQNLLSTFSTQITIPMAPELDEMLWDDAFAELDQLMAAFGALHTDIEFETAEAEIQSISEALKDVSFKEAITDVDLQRAQWLIDYWRTLVEEQKGADGSFALPIEELEKAESHLENLLRLQKELSQSSQIDFKIEGSEWSDALHGGAGDDDLKVVLSPEISERTWSSAFNELKTIVDNYGSELEVKFGDNSDIRKIGEELRNVDFSEVLTNNDLNKAKALLNYWKNLVEEQQKAGIGYVFPQEELERTEQYLAELTKAYGESTTTANALEEAQKRIAEAPVPEIANADYDKIAAQEELIRSIENVAKEVSKLESMFTSTTVTWVDDTNKRIAAIEKLIDVVEALNTASQAASLPVGSDIEGRYSGGPVSANSPYIVGERGPELFVPSNSGNIVPNNELSAGDTTEITLNFNGNKVGPMFSTKQIAKDVLREFEIMQGALS